MTAPFPMQLGLGSDADCGHATTSGRNKWGPNKPGSGYSRVNDPVAGSDRKVCSANSRSSTIDAYGTVFDTPLSGHYFILAAVNWDANNDFKAGSGGQCIFLQLRCENGGGTTVSVSLDHNSISGGYRGRCVAGALTGGGTTTFASNDFITAGAWGVVASPLIPSTASSTSGSAAAKTCSPPSRATSRRS